jgi:hypothetical protein
MVTFRGLVRFANKRCGLKSFVNKIEDSFWWSNSYVILKDDPEMFRCFEKNGFDRQDFFEKIDENKTTHFGFKESSRGYNGLILEENLSNINPSGIFNKYGGKDDFYFLSEIPLKKFEFSLDYWVKGRKMILDRGIHNYIVNNLSPDELHEYEGVAKYFKDNELVALYAGIFIDKIKN